MNNMKAEGKNSHNFNITLKCEMRNEKLDAFY